MPDREHITWKSTSTWTTITFSFEYFVVFWVLYKKLFVDHIKLVLTDKKKRKKKHVFQMYLVCSTKSGRLVVVWRVYNTTAATQEINSEKHDGPVIANYPRKWSRTCSQILNKISLKTIWGSTIMRHMLYWTGRNTSLHNILNSFRFKALWLWYLVDQWSKSLRNQEHNQRSIICSWAH